LRTLDQVAGQRPGRRDRVSARTTFDRNEYRAFFHIERQQIIVHSTMVLVHGIQKKTQKTPSARRWQSRTENRWAWAPA
jgi:phage-related protein